MTPAAGRRRLLRAAVALAPHPRLWFEAVAAAVALAPPGWWRRWPPVPVPDAAYWRFRMETAYGGDGGAPPQPDDVVDYLRWRRAARHLARRALR